MIHSCETATQSCKTAIHSCETPIHSCETATMFVKYISLLRDCYSGMFKRYSQLDKVNHSCETQMYC